MYPMRTPVGTARRAVAAAAAVLALGASAARAVEASGRVVMANGGARPSDCHAVLAWEDEDGGAGEVIARSPLDTEGHFHVQGSETNRFAVFYLADGQGRPLVGYGHVSGHLDFGELAIAPEAWMIGVVWGPDGGPITNVAVRLELQLRSREASRRHSSRHRAYLDVDTVRTEADGGFECHGLNTQRYRFSVDSDGYTGEPETQYLAADLNYVELSASRAATVTGVVTTVEGRPLAGIEVRAGRDLAARSRSDGGFRLSGLPPGEVELTAAGHGYAVPNNRPVTAALQPGGLARHDLTVAPVGALNVELKPESRRVRVPASVWLQLRDPADPRGGYPRREADVTGAAVRIDDLAPGDYLLASPGDVLGIDPTPVTIHSGQTTDVALVLPLVRTLAGSVTDENGRPLNDALVEIRGPQGRVTRAAARWHGRFFARGIRPGTLRIRLTCEGYRPLERTVEFGVTQNARETFVMQRQEAAGAAKEKRP